MLPKLLAAPEKANSRLGRLMHQSGKRMLRIFINRAHSSYKPVLDYKKENGWIKDHVKAELEGFDFIKTLLKNPMNVPNMNGWKDDEDPNCKMMTQVTELACLIQDEDSVYDWYMLLWLKWVHEHWDRFEHSAEQAYKLYNFPNVYKDLVEWSKPLPQDDGEYDNYDDMDYIAVEKKIMGEKHGMESKNINNKKL